MPDPTPFAPPSAGPEHAVFAKDVGLWEATIEVRLPGQPPQLSKGIAESRLICDGRWLVTDFRNETTGFEGHGVYGWDPARERYVGTWIDNMRTFLAVGEGVWDPATRTMTFYTDIPRPAGASVRWRETTQTVADDEQVFRSFLPTPAGEQELMVVAYRRRLPARP